MHLGTMVIVFFFSIENPKPTALLQSLKVNAEAAVNWKINSWEYQLLVCGYCEMIKIWFKLGCFWADDVVTNLIYAMFMLTR